MSFFDPSVICESWFKDCKLELCLFGNTFLIGAYLLCKAANWFALKISWLVSLWCGVFCWEVRRMECGVFAWVFDGEIFVGHRVSADFWANRPWICSDCAFWKKFSCRGVGWGLCILRGVNSEENISLLLFVIFKVAFSSWYLLNVDTS